MKNIIILSVFVFSSLIVFSQESKVIKPVSVSFSSGQGSLSPGPLLSANFSKGKDLIIFSLGERDVYAVYAKNIYKSIYSGPSLEYYHNIPTLGLMTSVGIYSNDNFQISMLNWFGVSAGKPGEKADFSKWQLLFAFQSLDISYKRLSLCTAALWYEEWGYLFELKYTQPLTKNFSAMTSAGYNFYKDGNYLFSIGLCYSF